MIIQVDAMTYHDVFGLLGQLNFSQDVDQFD